MFGSMSVDIVQIFVIKHLQPYFCWFSRYTTHVHNPRSGKLPEARLKIVENAQSQTFGSVYILNELKHRLFCMQKS